MGSASVADWPAVLTVTCCGRMQENTRPVCVAAGLAVVRVSSLQASEPCEWLRSSSGGMGCGGSRASHTHRCRHPLPPSRSHLWPAVCTSAPGCGWGVLGYACQHAPDGKHATPGCTGECATRLTHLHAAPHCGCPSSALTHDQRVHDCAFWPLGDRHAVASLRSRIVLWSKVVP